MKAAFFPYSWREGNPYLNLLADGLREAGVEVVSVDIDEPYLNWLLSNRHRIQVLHFHWLSPLYQRCSRSETIEGLLRFLLRTAVAKIMGYRIVWTFHNLLPHEQDFINIDKIVRYWMVILSNAIIAHCNFAKAELARIYRRRKNVYVIPLGVYPYLSAHYPIDANSPPWSRISREDTSLLFFGAIRPYKGLEELITTFRSITDLNIHLLIAGQCRLSEYERKLSSMVSGDQRIIFISKYLSDEELHHYLIKADAVVLPFKKILTSSSVMLAMSYGKAVIAPNQGCLPELIDHETGFLYDYDDREGLKKAICQCISKKNALEAMGKKSAEKVAAFTWDKIGALTFQVYHEASKANYRQE